MSDIHRSVLARTDQMLEESDEEDFELLLSFLSPG